MNAERREKMRGHTKRRWSECDQIAKAISTEDHKVTKHQVFRYLYDEYVQAGKLNDILDSKEETIQWTYTTAGWNRLVNEPKPLQVHEPGSEEQVPAGSIVAGDGEVIDEMGQLRLGAWFINKVGSVETARRIVEAVAAAKNKLKK